MIAYNSEFSKSASNGTIAFLQCGAVATAFVLSPMFANAPRSSATQDYPEVRSVAYHVGVNSSTVTVPFDRKLPNSVSGSIDLERAVTQFYADLSSKQEPLGQKFTEVLSENLWDLYIRT